MTFHTKTVGKPTDLRSSECYCSTDEGDEIIILTGSLELAAKEAAEEFYNRCGEILESQVIKVERGDGIIQVFKVTTEFEPRFHVEAANF